MKRIKYWRTIIGIVICMAFFAVSTASAIGYPNQSVTINKNQTSASSGNVYGHHKIYAASNSSTSVRSLYADVYYSSGSGWKLESSILMSRGANFDNAWTGIYGDYYLWKITLDPKGWKTTGCIGNGYIWYDQSQN